MKLARLRQYIVTAKQDDTIPLNAKIVAAVDNEEAADVLVRRWNAMVDALLAVEDKCGGRGTEPYQVANILHDLRGMAGKDWPK